jgi:hypothetical protein
MGSRLTVWSWHGVDSRGCHGSGERSYAIDWINRSVGKKNSVKIWLTFFVREGIENLQKKGDEVHRNCPIPYGLMTSAHNVGRSFFVL